MAIPEEDSRALMEGMMLHRKGLACVARTDTAAAASAAAAAAAVSAQNKRPRHQPGAPPAATTNNNATTSGTRNKQEGRLDGAAEDGFERPGNEQSGWEEHKENMPQEGGEDLDGQRGHAAAGDPDAVPATGGVEKLDETSASTVASGADDSRATFERQAGADGDAKGKGKLKPGEPSVFLFCKRVLGKISSLAIIMGG